MPLNYIYLKLNVFLNIAYLNIIEYLKHPTCSLHYFYIFILFYIIFKLHLYLFIIQNNS